MGCSREEGLLRSFWELRCERLSVRGRGALWTVLAVEGQVLDGDAWVALMGPWWRFVRARGPEERVREHELVRRREVRARNGKDA